MSTSEQTQLANDIDEALAQIDKLPGIDTAIKSLRYVSECLRRDQRVAVRASAIEPLPPEAYRYAEQKFRIGAHHAVTRLAEALDDAKSVEECQQLADKYADAIGNARINEAEHFDAGLLMARITSEVRQDRSN